MRILHTIASADPSHGGPIEWIKQLAAAIAPLGVSVEVASLDDPETSPWAADLPFPIHLLGPARGKFGYAPRFEAWLRTEGKAYDRIVVDGLWQFNGLAVWRTRRDHGRPYYVFPHGMLDPWFRRTYPLKHLRKQLYWLLGQYGVLRDAKAVVFTCEEERLQAQNAFFPWGPFQERIVTLGTAGSPFDLEAAHRAFLDAYPDLEKSRNLLFLSRIHEKKGCDLLIRAFAKVARRDPALRLVMAGPDYSGWKTSLEAIAAEDGIADRVVWTGMLKGETKWGAYAAAEAFTLTSHQENFGIVVAEALASGVPTLISDKVNIWREIEADGAGLVEPDDQAGADRLLERWLDLAPEVRTRMREAARHCFESRFEIDAAARGVRAVYLEE